MMRAARRAGTQERPGEGSPSGQRFERSARFWLRAFPRRWRAVHAAEATAVLAELAGPGTSRVPAKEAFSLVREGWATRWRGRPGLATWFLYRLVDVPIPPHLRAWAYDDITGALYPARAQSSATLVLLVFVVLGVFDLAPWPLAGLLAWWLLAAYVAVGHRRWRAIQRHVAPRPGDRLERGTLVVADGVRLRVDARAGLAAAAVVAATLTAAAWVAVAVGPLGWWWTWIPAGWTQGLGPVVDRRPALGAAAAGLALAGVAWILARRRVARVADEARDQPWREVVPIGAGRMVVLVAWTGVGVGVSAAEVAGALVLGWSVVVAAVGPAVVAGSLVARRALYAALPGAVGGHLTLPAGGDGAAALAAAGARAPALVDVWRVVTGRHVRVDGPVPVVVPIGGEMPVGAVAAPVPLGGPPTTLMA